MDGLIVTIFGFAGSGKDTSGVIIAEKLGLEHISSGSIFRSIARKQNLTLEELEKRSEIDGGVTDRLVDNEIQRLGEARTNIVVNSRLAWHFIPHSCKIFFDCPEEVRYQRIAEREKKPYDQAAEETLARDAGIVRRAKDYYRIENLSARGNFDLIIDTSQDPADIVAERVVSMIQNSEALLL